MVTYPFGAFSCGLAGTSRAVDEGDLDALVSAAYDPDRKNELRAFVLNCGGSWSVPKHLVRVIWQALRLRGIDDACERLEAAYPDLRQVEHGETADEWIKRTM